MSSPASDAMTMDEVKELPIGTFIEGLSSRDLPFEDVLSALNDVRDAFQHKVKSTDKITWISTCIYHVISNFSH